MSTTTTRTVARPASSKGAVKSRTTTAKAPAAKPVMTKQRRLSAEEKVEIALTAPRRTTRKAAAPASKATAKKVTPRAPKSTALKTNDTSPVKRPVKVGGKQMLPTKDTDPRIWANGNGAIYCTSHIGQAVRASIAESPRKRTHLDHRGGIVRIAPAGVACQSCAAATAKTPKAKTKAGFEAKVTTKKYPKGAPYITGVWLREGKEAPGTPAGYVVATPEWRGVDLTSMPKDGVLVKDDEALLDRLMSAMVYGTDKMWESVEYASTPKGQTYVKYGKPLYSPKRLSWYLTSIGF